VGARWTLALTPPLYADSPEAEAALRASAGTRPAGLPTRTHRHATCRASEGLVDPVIFAASKASLQSTPRAFWLFTLWPRYLRFNGRALAPVLVYRQSPIFQIAF